MRSTPVVVVVSVVVLGLLAAGCSDPGEREQLVGTLESEFDLDPAVADCVADQLYERFSDEEVDALREADSRDDLSEDLLTRLRAALTPCASAGS